MVGIYAPLALGEAGYCQWEVGTIEFVINSVAHLGILLLSFILVGWDENIKSNAASIFRKIAATTKARR